MANGYAKITADSGAYAGLPLLLLRVPCEALQSELLKIVYQLARGHLLPVVQSVWTPGQTLPEQTVRLATWTEHFRPISSYPAKASGRRHGRRRLPRPRLLLARLVGVTHSGTGGLTLRKGFCAVAKVHLLGNASTAAVVHT